MSKPTLTVTSDFTQEFNEMMKHFKNDSVLVGIPETARPRETVPGEPPVMNNATILAINEFGSPAANIPPRPVMAIGIHNAQDAIADLFRGAVINGLKTGLSALDTYYNRVGIIASTSVKKAINAQEGFTGPAPATLARRKADGFKGTKSLIVTGQMRNAITYVVKGGK